MGKHNNKVKIIKIDLNLMIRTPFQYETPRIINISRCFLVIVICSRTHYYSAFVTVHFITAVCLPVLATAAGISKLI